MSNWRVSKERIEILPHYNADSLELAKVGTYQVVVKKGDLKTGDEVIFVPEKSVLPDSIADDFRNYLAGPEKNRVKSVRLCGEVSCGIALPVNGYENIPIGQDISDELGIKKYEPPIPVSMAGDVHKIDEFSVTKHDCEHFGAYQDEFIPGEPIVVTEKIHGSQFILHRNSEGGFFISSKGLLARDLALQESEKNIYWRAANRMNLFDLLRGFLPSETLQVFGEVIPCQKGFKYGKENPTISFFEVRANGDSIPLNEIPDFLKSNWVPVIYEGPYDPETIRGFAKGKERVSGQELHIKEGVVVRPYEMRRAKDGTRLFVKILNPKYKETGDELQ